MKFTGGHKYPEDTIFLVAFWLFGELGVFRRGVVLDFIPFSELKMDGER